MSGVFEPQFLTSFTIDFTIVVLTNDITVNNHDPMSGGLNIN